MHRPFENSIRAVYCYIAYGIVIRTADTARRLKNLPTAMGGRTGRIRVKQSARRRRAATPAEAAIRFSR